MDELKKIFENAKTKVKTRERLFLHSGDFYNIYTYSEPIDFNNDSIHTHPYHEIFVLLDGKLNYIVNGHTFSLSVGDSAISSAGSPHFKSPDTDTSGIILIIEIADGFFDENNCTKYKKAFNPNNPESYKLSFSDAQEKGIYSIYKKLLFHCVNNEDKEYLAPFVKSLLIELLYFLNSSQASNVHTDQSQIQQIIEYINTYYKSKISLEDIADRMFMSKNHLCTMFKKHTGDTVKGYITKKRLAKTKQLTDNGHNISKACLLAGFPDYSAFYRAFLKANGKPPKDVLK